jgi:hypothetical protein
MNCQDFWNSVPQAAVRAADGRAWLPVACREHLEACPVCALGFAEQRTIALHLREMAADREHLQTPEHVEAALLREFRGLPRQAQRTRHWWMPAGSWAAAATVTAALAIVLLQSGMPRSSYRLQRSVRATEWDSMHLSSTEIQAYIPLPAVERVASAEELDLVRVEVPRSALVRLGMVVGPDWPAGPVKADVMIGPDGFARAIRILQ